MAIAPDTVNVPLVGCVKILYVIESPFVSLPIRVIAMELFSSVVVFISVTVGAAFVLTSVIENDGITEIVDPLLSVTSIVMPE